MPRGCDRTEEGPRSPSSGVAPGGAGTSVVPGPPLGAEAYARPVVEVARDLLGCLLVHGATVGRIVETEAYHETEGACHAWRPPPARPRPTARTAALFGPPGRAYVYRSYGIHVMLNAVCEAEGVAAAVLVRAVEPVAGIDLMRERRPGRRDAELVAGPGRLSVALDVRMEHDGSDLATGPIRVHPAPPHARPVELLAAPRIGITRAVDLPWRFVDASSRDVSRPWPAAMCRRR